MPDIVMPKLSESMTEGKLLRWNVKEGARVQEGDIIAEVETDKANMEIETLEAGLVRSLRAFPGDMVPVGTVIAVLEVDSGAASPESNEGFAGARAPAPPFQACMQALSQCRSRRSAGLTCRRFAERAAPDASRRRMCWRTLPSTARSPHLRGRGMIRGKCRVGAPRARTPQTLTRSRRRIRKNTSRAQMIRGRTRLSRPPIDSTASVIPIGSGSTADSSGASDEPSGDELDDSFEGQVADTAGAELVVLGGLSTMHVSAVADVTALLASLPAIRQRLPEGFRGITAEQFLGAVTAKAAARARGGLPLGEKEDEVGITEICISVQSGDDFAWHVLAEPRATSLQQLCVEILSAEADPDADAEPDVPACAFAIMNLGRHGADDFSGVIGEDEVPVLGIGALQESPRLRDGQWVNAQTMRISVSATASEIRPVAAARFLGRVRQLLEHPVLLAGF